MTDLDALAHQQGVRPVERPEDLADAVLWESLEELEEFLADTYAARRGRLANGWTFDTEPL